MNLCCYDVTVEIAALIRSHGTKLERVLSKQYGVCSCECYFNATVLLLSYCEGTAWEMILSHILEK